MHNINSIIFTLVTVGHDTVMGTVTFFAHPKNEVASFNGIHEYIYLDVLQDNETLPIGSQFAYIEFETPITCPIDSLLIGSKLDTDIHILHFTFYQN